MSRFRELAPKREEGFALLSVILLMTMVTLFAVTLLGLVLAQTGPTLLSNKSSRTQSAAQAGLDAAIGQLRNAESVDGTGLLMGDIHKLPCSVTGTVDGTGGSAHYSSAIQYFVVDPKGKDAAWRTLNALNCYTGTGTNGGVRSVPHFAMITAEGFDDTAKVVVDRADRILEATYTFQLTTHKVSGGMILDAGNAFCLVATSAAETAKIQYQLASDTECATQTDLNSWSWRDDYMIHLSSTDQDGADPLCLSGRAVSATPIAMTLIKCDTGTQDPKGQRWSWTGDYTWRGQNSTNTAYANTYIVNQDDTVNDGDYLSVSTASTFRSLTPLGAVGKGNASFATKQVVNQTYFGRCLDVTNANINYSYMITYPCKQDPSGAGAFDWNHKWTYAEPPEGSNSISTQISVNNGSKFCLITSSTVGLVGSPGAGTHGTVGTPAINVYYPRFVTGSNASDCTSTSTTWTRNGFNADVKLSYTFVDKNGRCLDAGGPKIDPEDTSGAKAWLSVTVATCNGSDDQKWNVPDKPSAASVGAYEEVTGRG